MHILKQLRPVQCLAASVLFRSKRLLLCLPRQKGGKTELGVRLLRDITSRGYNMSSLFLAKNKESGKRATREKFMRIFDTKEFVVNTEQVHLKKHPTSAVFMESVDKDPDRIRGGTNGFIHWSEVAFSRIEHGFTITDVFDRVIKPTLGETSGYALLESTNNGKNGWYDIWENYKDFKFARLKLGLSDFVYMGLMTQEEYTEIQESTHPTTFAQEYECEFVSFQGKVYDEFNERSHIDPDMAGPEPWMNVFGAIDWGYRPSATCVLLAYEKNGVIHVFDEHYAMEELPSVTADKIEEMKAKWNIKNLSLVADHDLARNEELNRRGIACGKADKTDVLGSRMEVKEKLYFHRLKFSPRCQYTRKDLDTITWDAKKNKDGEVDYNQCTYGHFDGESTTRYLCRMFTGFEARAPIVNPHLDGISQAAFDMGKERFG